jgi:hypothetical protein
MPPLRRPALRWPLTYSKAGAWFGRLFPLAPRVKICPCCAMPVRWTMPAGRGEAPERPLPLYCGVRRRCMSWLAWNLA